VMATVLIDRYEVKCSICGWHTEFMVGAGMGDFHAVERANALHSQQVSRLCKSDLTVVKLAKQEAMTPPHPETSAGSPLSGLEFCPRCSSGPRQKADTVECPDCGYRWSGPRLLDILTPESKP
jgi:hypothetical protein